MLHRRYQGAAPSKEPHPCSIRACERETQGRVAWWGSKGLGSAVRRGARSARGRWSDAARGWGSGALPGRGEERTAAEVEENEFSLGFPKGSVLYFVGTTKTVGSRINGQHWRAEHSNGLILRFRPTTWCYFHFLFLVKFIIIIVIIFYKLYKWI